MNKIVHHRATTLHVHIHMYILHIYIYIHHTTHINYHSWQKNQPSRQWLLLKKLLWPKPWHYYHLFKYLEEFLNALIHKCDIFWVLTLNRRSHIHADLFNSSFFIRYFPKQRPISDHCQEDSLSYLMLINAFLSFFDSKTSLGTS